jgi:Ca-activated chloride channel homolog
MAIPSVTVRGVRLSLALAVLLAGAGLFFTASPEAQRIKVTTQTVPIYVTVVDGERRLVPDLVQEDFEVLDNGKVQTLTNFDNSITPFTAVVMLDTSGSMTLNLDFVKQAAEQFLMRLLPQDKAKVGAFNDKIQVLPRGEPFTNDRDRLIRILKDGLDFGYPTRLWDAVDESMAELETVEGRRVVIVFTDGDDTASKAGLGDVLARARDKDMLIYAVGLSSDYFNGQTRVRTRPDRGLRKIADETGGGFFELQKKDELGPTFTRVAQELHSQYVLGFSPAALDGKIHKLDVKVRKPGMTGRGRKSYLASPATPTTGGI